MYAIVLDLDVTMLEQMYPTPSWRNADRVVGDVLNRRGFERQQGSTYFGNERTTAVDCVLAVQELKRIYDRFQPTVSEIRMLRIEENTDLSPALQ
ncbi:virulence factor [Sphingomonas sp.]|uniref:virulence factor n=1 Tax=Sphingomonas sp. TaxID=28214 RepID=UPI00333F0C6E